jgi:phenylalanine ammonia-lyase
MPTATVSAAVTISTESLNLEDIIAVARSGQTVRLSEDGGFRRHIARGPEAIRGALERGELIYGVNTGFGGNVRFVIPDTEMQHHQENLLDFLSCGVGDPLPDEVVRAAMLLRANALARGYLLRTGLGAVALAVEALGSSPDYYHPLIHMVKHHPGQLRAAEMLHSMLMESKLAVPLDEIRGRVSHESAHPASVVEAHESIQSPYSLRCAPQGLGPMLETLEQARLTIEREANSVNDNPLFDPDQQRAFHTGNFYGGHIARAMDGLKLDMANLANWTHSLLALLMDERFSAGLPNSLSPHPGVYQGFKGMQIVHTSLVTALRQMSAPSLIHTLPTEQFNQDIVSLGAHAALSAMDMLRLLQDSMAITLLSLAQAIDLRRGSDKLGAGTKPIYHAVRERSRFVEADRPLDGDIARVSKALHEHGVPVLQ